MKRVFVACALTFLMASANCLAADSKGTIDPVSGKPCYTCHRSKVSSAFIHDALAGNECGPCHENTGGNHQLNHSLYAVKDRSAALCYNCHDAKADAKSTHPVIAQKGCIACHGPHTSPSKNLLRAEVPTLCFTCHKRTLVEEKESRTTGFRDGIQNLHYLHAGEKNGIPCLTCHDMHSSTQLHLIRPKGVNGKEAVTITYTGSEKGGNCAASCHDPLGYERK